MSASVRYGGANLDDVHFADDANDDANDAMESEEYSGSAHSDGPGSGSATGDQHRLGRAVPRGIVRASQSGAPLQPRANNMDDGRSSSSGDTSRGGDDDDDSRSLFSHSEYPHGGGGGGGGGYRSRPPPSQKYFRPRFDDCKSELWLKPREFLNFIRVNGEEVGFFTAHRQIAINIPIWKLSPGARVLADLRRHRTTLGEESSGDAARASISAVGCLMAMIGLHADGTAPNGSHIQAPAPAPDAPAAADGDDYDGDGAPDAQAPDSRGRSRGGRGAGKGRGRSGGDSDCFRYVFEVDEGDGVKRAVPMRVNMIEYIQGAPPDGSLNGGGDVTVAIRLWVCVLDAKFHDVTGVCRLMASSYKQSVTKAGRGPPPRVVATTPTP